MTSKDHIKTWKSAIIVKRIEDKHAKDNIYCKVKNHCQYTVKYRDAAHSICNLKYSVPTGFKKDLLDILTDIDMLLIVEKGIRGEMCYVIYRYAKAYNKYMRDYDKNKESSYLKRWDVNNLYG